MKNPIENYEKLPYHDPSILKALKQIMLKQITVGEIYTQIQLNRNKLIKESKDLFLGAIQIIYTKPNLPFQFTSNTNESSNTSTTKEILSNNTKYIKKVDTDYFIAPKINNKFQADEKLMKELLLQRNNPKSCIAQGYTAYCKLISHKLY